MNVVGVIPARFNSTRFEGKIIADLLGKPMIQHVYEKAKEARSLDDLVVAADDDRVMEAVKGFGGKAVFTSPEQPTGSDRIAEVVNPMDVKIVVNIQGDEPLIEAKMIDDLASAMLGDESIVMATLIKKIDNEEEINDHNVVKVVVDKDGFALYFSRSPIPYARTDAAVYYKHIGLYAYTKDFLFTFTNLLPLKLEKSEALEQLRVLEYGYRIKTVETEFDTVGVDAPEDLERVKEILSRGNYGQGSQDNG